MPRRADDVRVRGRVQHDVAERFLGVRGIEVAALHELLDDLIARETGKPVDTLLSIFRLLIR